VSRFQQPHSEPVAPILRDKHHDAPSAFKPENLLREATRQKGLKPGPVPTVGVLDPDGDIVRQLKRSGSGTPDSNWACYHTELWRVSDGGHELGIVPCAVGASFAVLVAEQLFASGCKLLISMSSAGRLSELRPPPYFVLIEKALRDEGTSYHYAPPSEYSEADPALIQRLSSAFEASSPAVIRGPTWTTDAPFRETSEAIAAMSARGLLAVEMEAAALYAFSRARGRPVVCFAHVTNQMARIEGDFEKGEADGTVEALQVIRGAAQALLP